MTKSTAPHTKLLNGVLPLFSLCLAFCVCAWSDMCVCVGLV